MNAAIVDNPDGTSFVVVPPVGVGERDDSFVVPTEGPAAQGPATGKSAKNPFLAQDQIAMEELQRQKKQFEAALAGHTPVDKDFIDVAHQDASARYSHETYDTYQAPSILHDKAVQGAIEQTDVCLQGAVAAMAAGPDPVLPADPSLIATPGMDWLERMKREDERLRAAVDRNDTILRPPANFY